MKWNLRSSTGLSCLSILSRSSSSSCSPEALTQPSEPLTTASSHFPLCPGRSPQSPNSPGHCQWIYSTSKSLLRLHPLEALVWTPWRASRSLKLPSLQVLQQGNWDGHLERALLSLYSYIPFWTWPRFILYLRCACVFGLASVCRVRNGLLYDISKGLNLVVVLGSALTLKRAVGSRRYRGPDIS